MNEFYGFKRLKVSSIKIKEEEVKQDEEMSFTEKVSLKPIELIKKVEFLKPVEAKAGMMAEPDNVEDEKYLKIDTKDHNSPFFLMKYLEIQCE